VGGRALPGTLGVHGLVLGSAPEGPTISVLGWNTGTIGKLFVLGIAVIVLAARAPASNSRSLPERCCSSLGTGATVLVLIRVISIPDEYAGTTNRAVGLWVGLASAVIVIVAGLVRAGEEL
jgi:peptidoglycan/LPS O-acetylase OafA/YrhL